MKINNENQMDDYAFLKLLLALMITNNYGNLINKDKLEQKLYELASEVKYSFMFQDIIFRYIAGVNYADLSNAFLKAYTHGLIAVTDNKTEELKCLIKLNREDANNILLKHTRKEIDAMNEIVLQIKEEQENLYKPYTTGYLMPTERKDEKIRKYVYIK